MFVLDEADEMLSRGFKDQIYDVFRHLDSKIQVWIIVNPIISWGELVSSPRPRKIDRIFQFSYRVRTSV